MTRGQRSRVPSVDEVRSRFEQWRQTRQRRARIPDELWSVALQLARRDGVHRMATALHLDGGKLKRRMVPSQADVPRKPMPPAFVELMWPGAAPSPALRFPWTLICDKENQDVQHETLGFRARGRSPEGD